MSIYSKVESGTSWNRSRFSKSISYNIQYDCRFGDLVPVCRKFVLPGDVWRIGGQALVRLHPMVSPPMNKMLMKVRYFFVPLRLVEPNSELIITGSKDGKLYTGTLPTFENLFAKADINVDGDAYKVTKYSFWDYMGLQTGDYSNFSTDAVLSASYWRKGYDRICYDYYDDENIGYIHSNFSDFDSYTNAMLSHGGNRQLFNVNLPKDYFTSSLTFQLKAVAAPVINVGSVGSFTPNYTGDFFTDPGTGAINVKASINPGTPYVGTGSASVDQSSSAQLRYYLNRPQSINITQLGFTADDLRTMMAQTRIFERLARAGSRYVEYLRANFGTAPADDTLQRAQYLGGWKLPIVTTEVLQTAQGTDPVGTMRGHGISNGGNVISTFQAKEFGMIFGLAHILPEIKYTTGAPKELSYKARFDFFNPSFQHLSEQEVRNGELFIGNDGANDNTFGFQAYANELRSSVNLVVAEMRSGLSYWNQAIAFNSRPSLNTAFIESETYLANFNQCFAVSGTNARPLIVEFQNIFDVYRPMVRYSTPGLVDHL